MTIIVSLSDTHEGVEVSCSELYEVRSDTYPLKIASPYILRTDSKATKEQLMQLAACAPTYLDGPHDMPKELFLELKKNHPDVKIIASFHDFEKTPDNLEEIYWQMRTLGADVIKIVGFANSSLDSLRMLLFLKKHAHLFPMTAFCMGDKASFTRILQPVFGGVWTYASSDKGFETAAGQIASHILKESYHFESLSSKTKVFALVGDPLDKSYSDLIHNANFRKLALDAIYVKIPMKQDEFLSSIPYFQKLGFTGLSVTMPLKQCFDEYQPYNTVSFCNDEVLLYNTDGRGAFDAIVEQMDVRNKKVLIIGAGGTAVAICQEAKKRGAKVAIFNRTYEKAKLVAEKEHVQALVELDCKGFDVIVNATSVDFDLDEKDAVVLDVRIGTASGERLWLHQAAKQLTIWFKDELQVITSQKSLQGKMRLPPSKSQTLRALLFATFAEGKSKIIHPLNSPDTEAMVSACIALGAKIERLENGFVVEGVGKKRKLAESIIDAANSGIVLRFAGACLGLFSEEALIFGDKTTEIRRSCRPLVEALKQLGAKVSSNNGHAPLQICGPIRPGVCTIDGQDSQPVSSLLIASSLLEGTSEISVRSPGEKPWVELTLKWLEKMGVKVTAKDDCAHFTVHGKGSFLPFEYEVAGDLSGLAYPLVAALFTNSHLVIENADLTDAQGDKKLIQILEEMGAKFCIDEKLKTITIKGPQQLTGAKIDCNDLIDMVTILAVVGTQAEGETIVYNAEVSRDKESDRIRTTVAELKKMGADIEEAQDGFVVRKSKLQAAAVFSHGDHRLAMTLAVAALFTEAGECTMIHDAACVKKSYPGFFDDLAKVFTT